MRFPQNLPTAWRRASASKNAVSRERLARLDIAADLVTPRYRPATAADLYPTCSTRTSMAVPSIRWLPATPTRKECKVHRLSSMPAARRRVWRFKVICASVSDFSLCLAVFSDAREQKTWTLREGPPRGPIAWTLRPVGTRSWRPSRRFRDSRCFSSPLPLGRIPVSVFRKGD